jgi:hypothetical protein
MNPISYLVQRRLNLPPPLTRNLVVQRDRRVPMRDASAMILPIRQLITIDLPRLVADLR